MISTSVQTTTLFILFFVAAGSSLNIFPSNRDVINHKLSRLKRQNIPENNCISPKHPLHGYYTLPESVTSYIPNSPLSEYTTIHLNCTHPYVAQTNVAQSLCVSGEWSPDLSQLGKCVEPNALTTTETPFVAGETCILPAHPPDGKFTEFSIDKPYRPGATVSQFTTVHLLCSEKSINETGVLQSLCIEGEWSPNISNLEKCSSSSFLSSSVSPDTNDCVLPNHPELGEFKITGRKEGTYTPLAYVPQHSIIELVCKSQPQSENKSTQALCVERNWYPPISDISCIQREGALNTTTPSVTLGDSCTLPDHSGNGKFKILGDTNVEYVSGAHFDEFTNIQLTCPGQNTDNRKISKSICFNGKWTPPISDLEQCTEEISTTTIVSRSRNGCVLPTHQTHGKYREGSDRTFDQIILACNNGYYPKFQSHICDAGIWYPPLSTCIRICPPLKISETYTATCTYKYNNISCENALEGTEVYVTCKPFFIYRHTRPITKCNGGSWSDEIAPCVPECGVRRVPVQPLVIKGYLSDVGEYPWLVGIYWKNATHTCGGSIISRHYVLSAAHCFTEYDNIAFAMTPVNKNDYIVAAGKYFIDLYDSRDKHSQITKLKRIFISNSYLGSAQNFRYDYAILEVETPFVLTEYVQPVCIDWNSQYELEDLKDDNPAVVAGWGYTLEASNPSEKLKKLPVTFKNRESCEINLPKDFQVRYYLDDKLCAGHIGHAVCQGDSGGGLYFEHNQVFFIRGIVSVSPRSKIGCSLEHYALYTNLSPYLRSITKETGRII